MYKLSYVLFSSVYIMHTSPWDLGNLGLCALPFLPLYRPHADFFLVITHLWKENLFLGQVFIKRWCEKQVRKGAKLISRYHLWTQSFLSLFYQIPGGRLSLTVFGKKVLGILGRWCLVWWCLVWWPYLADGSNCSALIKNHSHNLFTLSYCKALAH